MALALLERDIQILEFIAKFGFCQDKHIITLCNLTPKYYLKVIKRLVDEDYIERTRILAYEDAYLMLTKTGAKFLGLSKEAKPVLNTLNHDTLLIDLYFKLQQLHPNAYFKTDKELRRDHSIFEANETKRLPDILIDDNIAIELELSEKPIAKLTNIVNSYILTNEIIEVHYYVESMRIYNRINSLVLDYPKFKFFMLNVQDKLIHSINPINPINPHHSINNTSNVTAVKKFGAYIYAP